MNTTLRTALIAVAAAGIALTGGVLLASGGPGSGSAGSADPTGAVTSLDVTTSSLAADPAAGVDGDEGAATPGDATPADGAGDGGTGGAASGGATDDGATDEGATDEGATDEGVSSGGAGSGGEPSGEPVPDGPTGPEPDHQPLPQPEPADPTAPADPAPTDPAAPADPAPAEQPQPQPAGDPGVTVPGQLYLGAAVTKALPLASTGGAPLEWSVVSDDAWLSVTSPTSGVLAPGASTSLTVRVDRRLTPQQAVFGQPYIGTLRLDTSAGAKVVTVRAIPVVTAVDGVCITKLVLGAPFHQVSYQATITLSANDTLTAEVTGPNPKAAAPVAVVNGSAKTAVLLPAGARATSKLVLRPSHGPQVVVPLAESCTPAPSPAGSLAEASA